jgi:diguanylate cyclase
VDEDTAKIGSLSLNYAESSEQAHEFLRLVLQMLAKFSLVPNPVNFTLCYEYVSGHNQELALVLDNVLHEEKGLTPEAATELYKRYIWDDERRSVDKQSSDLYMVMSETISEIDQTASKAAESSSAINKYSLLMEEYEDLHEMRNIISEVVAETKTIAESSHQLRKMLSDTKVEVENLREELQRSREQAATDTLTGLLNRRAFNQQLAILTDDAAHARQSLGLMIIDIDYFKRVNDKFGHLIGDKVIRFIGNQITSNIKGKDMAARFGGEEFAVLLPNTQLDQTRILAESIRASIEKSKLIRTDTSQPITGITVSIGITSYKFGENTDHFIHRADKAMYKSKNSGRNKVSIAY